MTNTAVTVDQLTKGTVIRFQPSILRSTKLTVRLTKDADYSPVDGNVYAVVFGYRVRPNAHNVSFGQRKVYCINVNRAEVVGKVES